MRFNNVALMELIAACMVAYHHAFPLSGGGGRKTLPHPWVED